MASVFFRFVLVAAVGWLVVAANGIGEAAKESSAVTLVAVQSPDEGQGSGVDLTKLPIGDGKISSTPKAGYLWSCNQMTPTRTGSARRTSSTACRPTRRWQRCPVAPAGRWACC